jgi:hypothetical protein
MDTSKEIPFGDMLDAIIQDLQFTMLRKNICGIMQEASALLPQDALGKAAYSSAIVDIALNETGRHIIAHAGDDSEKADALIEKAVKAFDHDLRNVVAKLYMTKPTANAEKEESADEHEINSGNAEAES